MKNIVVPLDFSDQTDVVLRLASEMGKAFGAHLWLLHVAAPEPDFVGYGPAPDCVREQAAKLLREELSRVQRLARRLAGFAPEAIALAKASVLAATPDPVPGLLEEAYFFQQSLRIPDTSARMARFLDIGGQTPEGELRVGELGGEI